VSAETECGGTCVTTFGACADAAQNTAYFAATFKLASGDAGGNTVYDHAVAPYDATHVATAHHVALDIPSRHCCTSVANA
jgi:hypothetical protein